MKEAEKCDHRIVFCCSLAVFYTILQIEASILDLSRLDILIFLFVLHFDAEFAALYLGV